jgi:GntR family transcriptional repressor for pyruvate dehydrogenase complex
MAENKSENMSAKTGRMLESMILSGELKIGSQLPTERELAEAMGVSKGIVHTAIAELSRKGFLRIVPRHGVYVADYTKNGTLDVLSAIASFNGGEIDRALAESVIKTRLALEGESVYELAMNHTGAQIARLRSLAGGIHAAVADGRIADSRSMAEKLQEFYLAKCIMSGNQIIPIFANASAELSIALTEKWVCSVGFDSVLKGLDRAVDCIAAGDGLGAIKSVKSCCDEAIESLYM